MEIWRVKDEEGESDHLSYASEYFSEDEIVTKTPTRMTFEELVELCDHDAENKNFHAFCGTHKALGNLLLEHCSAKTAVKILRAIAEQGGLHEMTNS